MCAPGLKFSRQFRKAYKKRLAVESTYCAFSFSSGGFIIESNERRKQLEAIFRHYCRIKASLKPHNEAGLSGLHGKYQCLTEVQKIRSFRQFGPGLSRKMFSVGLGEGSDHGIVMVEGPALSSTSVSTLLTKYAKYLTKIQPNFRVHLHIPPFLYLPNS
ncbi:hypothetical protein T03_2713 [Trichinella britovi]|uniref:Uncharacterized protein n=1 Tax=Trichinella britovi TaxID=45882 RepID=A0A0V1D3H7_TRIBR|nr:hypothetical protein T03_13277 [Trichinella britovi]KRY56069.1 hypothetical protein T03_2713 [Trichinella britovi]